MPKVVLITGCSTGIGRALAKEFQSREGHIVYATARKPSAIEDLKGEGIKTLALDVVSDESVQAAVAAILAKEARIDILVNNAGLAVHGATIALPLDSIQKQFDTNVTGLLRVCQVVGKQMMEQQSGTIVNIASIAACITAPFSGPYSATKAAVRSLSDGMRLELQPFGVKVLCVFPGAVKSEIAQNTDITNQTIQDDPFYEPIKAEVTAVAVYSQQDPTPVEEFARDTVSYIIQPAPARYFFKGKMGPLYILQFLPLFITDYLFSANLGLHKLAKIVQQKSSGKKSE